MDRMDPSYYEFQRVIRENDEHLMSFVADIVKWGNEKAFKEVEHMFEEEVIVKRTIEMARVRLSSFESYFASKRMKTRHGDEPLVKSGLVLGAYDGCNTGELKMTATASKYDDEIGGPLQELLNGSGLSLGKANVYNNLEGKFFAIAIAGLGPEGLGLSENESLNECKENIRIASAVGARALQEAGVTNILVENFSDAEAAAEGAALALWGHQEFQDKANKVHPYNDIDKEAWERGIHKAESQNIARLLEYTSTNCMTPSLFTQKIIEILCPCGIQLNVHDQKWMAEKNMTAFLELTKRSYEPPLILELTYCGGREHDMPVVMVGKGTTYGTSGIRLKSPEIMAQFQPDMVGAAVIVGTMKAMAALRVPINVNALIPLYEYMPGSNGIQPGDIAIDTSGKRIRIVSKAREAMVALSDALTYTTNYKPFLIINMGTFSDGIGTALGASSTGVITTSNIIWRELRRAGAITGDRVWKVPGVFAAFNLNNVGRGSSNTCMGPVFHTKVPPVGILHLDITGSGMLSTGNGFPYIREGTMSGRPIRTLVQFLYQMARLPNKGVCRRRSINY